MRRTAQREIVLALYPTARGFGWALFEAPLSPIDWGLAKSGSEGNAKLLRRFSRICKRYSPTVLVLEEFRDDAFRRGPRIHALCDVITREGSASGMNVVCFQRAFIRKVFSRFGASTRFEIGEYIRRKIDSLGHHTPRKRAIWENADLRQNLFDAAALALVYFVATGRQSDP